MIIGNDDSEFGLRGVWSAGRQGNLGQLLSGLIVYLVLCVFLLLVTSLFAEAQTHADGTAEGRTLVLEGPVATASVSPKIEYYLDETGNLEIGRVSAPPVADSFLPITTATPNFGYTKSAVWLRLRMLNATTGTTDWRILFRENFMQQFAAWKVVEGSTSVSPEMLIFQDEQSDFASRPVQYPELVVPLKLEPGQAADIYVRYQSGGSSELSFSVESAASFATVAARKSAKNFIYYGMVVLLCIIAILSFVVTRQAPFLAYALYALSALMYIVHADGNGFAYLWPNEPVFNAFATILIGSALGIFCANFARIFLETRIHHPVMDKFLLGNIALILAALLSSFFVDHMLIKKYLILMVLAAILLATLSGFVAAFHRFKKVRFYVLAWTGVLISAGILTARHWLGIEISEETQFDSMRIVVVVDAVMMGLAIWDSLNQTRRERHIALKSSLVTAERNLRLNKRLQDLEERYQLAVELSEKKSRQMRSTIHDLRQPLHALRLNIKGLGNAASPQQDTGQIDRTFDFLETLVQDHLSSGSDAGSAAARMEETETGPASIAREESEADEAEGREGLAIAEILESVHEMFLPDAQAKGLELDLSLRDTGVTTEPLVLMRILNNLIANAIKYTARGSVLIANRDLGDRTEIEIRDTGPGMSREEFEEARREGVRLANAPENDGYGLGLAIVHELAHQHGYSVFLRNPKAGGASIVLEMPKTGQQRPVLRELLQGSKAAIDL